MSGVETSITNTRHLPARRLSGVETSGAETSNTKTNGTQWQHLAIFYF
ncbi:hypothetical protein [Dyadobacter jejuensis]|nr:hypothetical protein [Dyadobacter jejuensis]